MTDDDTIKRMNENLQNDAYGESWLKPLLALIEYEQTDDSKVFFIDLDKSIHADHILPVGWASVSDWNAKWTKTQANKWLNKIGNLTLLSGKKNIAQQNDPPTKKAEMYKKGYGGTTALKFPKYYSQLVRNCWVELDVEQRQKWALEQIESIFALKF